MTNSDINESNIEEIKEQLKEINKKLSELSKNTGTVSDKTKTETLSKAQEDVLNAAQAFFKEHKTSPTVKDLAVVTPLSESTIAGYLNTLSRKGFLDKITEHKSVSEGRKVRIYRYKPT